jgi:hypothetical protein
MAATQGSGIEIGKIRGIESGESGVATQSERGERREERRSEELLRRSRV